MADRVIHRVGRQRLVAAAGALVLVGLVGYPLTRLAFEATGSTLSSSAVGEAAFNSLWSSVAAASIATLIGFGAAVLTERSEMRWPGGLRAALIATLVVPPFVSALSWRAMYAPFGLLDDLVGVSAAWIDGRTGVVVVIAVNTVPLVFLITAAALRSSRLASLEWGARASGATAFETFRRVTVPLVRPALAAGWLVAFAASLASFGVPVVLGTPAGFATLTTRVYGAVAFSGLPGAFGEAVVMALLLAAVALVLVAVGDRFGAGALDLAARGNAAAPYRHAVPNRVVAVAWLYVIVTLLLPFVALVMRAVTPAVGVSAAPANWTLANFSGVLDSRTWEALGRSAGLAATAAVVALAVGSLLVYLERVSGRGWGTVALASFAIPGTTIALALSVSYGRWLRDTATIILLAYVAKLLALAHRPVSAATAGLHRDVIHAARASGGSPVRVARHVIAPLLRPALVAGGLLVFLFGLHELTMSSILHGPGSETLAVVILDYQQIGDPTATAALAVVLSLVVAAVVGPLLGARRLWGGRL